MKKDTITAGNRKSRKILALIWNCLIDMELFKGSSHLLVRVNIEKQSG
jgi:hypothetical protein